MEELEEKIPKLLSHDFSIRVGRLPVEVSKKIKSILGILGILGKQ
jgi:hypothetical protein